MKACFTEIVNWKRSYFFWNDESRDIVAVGCQFKEGMMDDFGAGSATDLI